MIVLTCMGDLCMNILEYVRNNIDDIVKRFQEINGMKSYDLSNQISFLLHMV